MPSSKITKSTVKEYLAGIPDEVTGSRYGLGFGLLAPDRSEIPLETTTWVEPNPTDDLGRWGAQSKAAAPLTGKLQREFQIRRCLPRQTECAMTRLPVLFNVAVTSAWVLHMNFVPRFQEPETRTTGDPLREARRAPLLTYGGESLFCS